MQRIGLGVAILAVALGVCWGIVWVGQTYGLVPVTALIGTPQTPAQGAAAETIFNLVVFAPLLIAGLIGGATERRNAAAPGVAPGRGLAVGLAIGLAGLSACTGYAWLAGAVVPPVGPVAPASPLLLAWGLAVVLLQTGAEEVFFRGWLQPALVRRWGAPPGVVAAALAFAALHIAGAPEMLGPVPLANLFLGGLMFGLLALHGRGIAAAVGVHWAWNSTEQLAFGLDPNPGVGGFGAAFDHDLAGRALWGGTADGLNGSIGMTFVLLAILAPLAAMAWRRGSQPATKPRPLTASAQPG